MSQNRTNAVNTANYPIQSVSRALTLLLRFRDQPTLSVSEASEYLSVSRSTAHRSLAMLLQHGFVKQDSRTKLYEAGPALLQIGLAAVSQIDARAVAQPYLRQLVKLTQETAHLVVLSGSDVLFLDGVESTRAVRSGLRVGVSVPAHTTASGKAILATLPTGQLRSLYPSEQLATLTARTLRTYAELDAELDKARERGYAVNDEESEEGLRAVAASVTDGSPLLRVLPALTVAGPKERLTPDRIPEIGEIVHEQALAMRDSVLRGE